MTQASREYRDGEIVAALRGGKTIGQVACEFGLPQIDVELAYDRAVVSERKAAAARMRVAMVDFLYGNSFSRA